MPPRVDIGGMKFGKWEVIKKSPKKSYQVFWICKCECGNIRTLRGTALRSGESKSCGCSMEEYKNIIGKKFGRWTVIDKSNKRLKGYALKWRCMCECGNISYISASILRTGKSKSCGKCISNKKDILGQKFGRWTVLEEIAERKNESVYWKCKCDCGNTGAISGNGLRTGLSKSCGCLMRVRKINPDRELAIFKRLYGGLINRNRKCKNKNIITIKEFIELSKLNCHYCNSSPSNTAKEYNGKISNTRFNYTGLDQIIANDGYVKDNVVPCCINCNRIKGVMKQTDFKNLVVNIYNNWAKKSIGSIILLYQHGEIIGRKIGKITVLNKTINKKFGNSVWNCVCECGKQIHLATFEIRTKRITSCGCQPMNHLVYNDRKFVMLKRAYGKIKHNKRNSPMDEIIGFEEFSKLSLLNCFYCDAPPTKTHIDRGSKHHKWKTDRKESICTNGVDRIDSGRGYIVNNVRSCCRPCNMAKNKLHEDQFKKCIIDIYNHWARK